MPDFRVHSPTTESQPRQFVLSREESHHLVTVNRARAGDPVVAFDGKGREWDCELCEAQRTAAVLSVRGARRVVALPHALTLAQALPKGPCMDAIVRKATELGAACIRPMVTSRTLVRLDEERRDRKGDKWQQAALEAAKQCGNPWVPEIRPVATLEEVLADLATMELCLVASLHPGAGDIRTAVRSRTQTLGHMPRSVLWLVGPEGDFSPEEIKLIAAAGVLPVTLGPLVLRCETAAVAALAILAHELSSA